MKVPSFSHLSDTDLTREGARIISLERQATAAVISWLIEFDKRRLYLGLGYSSLFSYGRDALHLGDGAAYRRIEAACVCRRFPGALQLIVEGGVTLTNLGLIAPHLTPANCAQLFNDVSHKSKREVEIIVARLAPKPDAATTIRKTPSSIPRPIAEATQEQPVAACHEASPLPPPRPVIAPLAPERFKLQITMSQETHYR